MRGVGKRLTDAERDEIASLYISGYKSLTLLSKRFGVCPKTIYNVLKRKGIQRRKGMIKTEPSITVPHNPTILAYFAGILDGEGSIGFVKDKTMALGSRPYVAITNTSKALLHWLLSNFKGYVKTRKPPRGHFGKKKCLTWRVERTIDIYLLLKSVFPFLVVKKKKAKEVLNFVENRLKEKGFLGYAEELLAL
ncbi:MAG: helix-turn-helix domain-containing protein [Candidatus Bathyarchaeia archaeon]